jgi:hypothetical protein
MYVRGYLQGSENGRVVTIVNLLIHVVTSQFKGAKRGAE